MGQFIPIIHTLDWFVLRTTLRVCTKYELTFTLVLKETFTCYLFPPLKGGTSNKLFLG
jgi:hypothetical protein